MSKNKLILITTTYEKNKIMSNYRDEISSVKIIFVELSKNYQTLKLCKLFFKQFRNKENDELNSCYFRVN